MEHKYKQNKEVKEVIDLRYYHNALEVMRRCLEQLEYIESEILDVRKKLQDASSV